MTRRDFMLEVGAAAVGAAGVAAAGAPPIPVSPVWDVITLWMDGWKYRFVANVLVSKEQCEAPFDNVWACWKGAGEDLKAIIESPDVVAERARVSGATW